MSEVVYFIQSRNGPIKIGKTANLKRRVHSLKTSSPATLTLLGVMLNDDGLERKLHDKFSDLRLEGEWFSPNHSLIEWIAQNADKPGQIKDRARSDGCRFTQTARRYVETLERRFAEENGWQKPDVRNHVADSVGIPRGTIRRLMTFTLVTINAETFEKIEQFYVENTLETLRLCKERLAVLKRGDDPFDDSAAGVIRRLSESEAVFSHHRKAVSDEP